jgi:alkylation response protein AidB-like acyl-CoA dehydrogenase
MLMNVQPIGMVSDRVNEVRALTAQIVNKEILPNENLLWAHRSNTRLTAGDVEQSRELREHIKSVVKQAGLWAPHLPVEYGGAGLSLASTSRIIAEIARVDRSVAIMIGLHAGLGTRGLVEHGSPELKREWLPRLASGTCVASFAATEASAGSDLTAIRTTGESTARGLRLDGEKSYVTNGGFAGLFTALVRTPGLGGGRAFSLVAIPRGTPGVEIGREEDKLGIRGSSTVTVRFDGAVVPWSHVLGDPGRGTELTHGLLAWGRSLCLRVASGPRARPWTQRSSTWPCGVSSGARLARSVRREPMSRGWPRASTR